MQCRGLQAQWDGKRWGTGLILEYSQLQTTHLWTAKEMQIQSWMRMVSGIGKRTNKKYLTCIKSAAIVNVDVKWSCNPMKKKIGVKACNKS